MLDDTLILPTNWDLALLDAVKPMRPVYQYGSLPTERTMRSVLSLPAVSEERVIDYVRRASAMGIRCLYVMNATCMGNAEMSEEGRFEILQRLQWVSEAGFAGVTVANPLVMEMARSQFPQLELQVSLLAAVDGPRKANFYAELGASVIHLDPVVARDFRRIRAIRRAVDCRLSLVVNEGCLLECAMRSYHSNVVSHSLQSITGGYHADYCTYRCAAARLADPTELLRMPWVRPEDTDMYREAGINLFKIAGREKMGGGAGESHTDWIVRVARAYHQQRCDDVASLLVGMEAVQPLRGGERTPEPRISIDSRRLDGFLDFFKSGHCDFDCSRCSYCGRYAQAAVKVEEVDAGYGRFLDESLEAIRIGSYWTGAPH